MKQDRGRLAPQGEPAGESQHQGRTNASPSRFQSNPGMEVRRGTAQECCFW